MTFVGEARLLVAFIESPNYSSGGPISAAMAAHEANCWSSEKPTDTLARNDAKNTLLMQIEVVVSIRSKLGCDSSFKGQNAGTTR